MYSGNKHIRLDRIKPSELQENYCERKHLYRYYFKIHNCDLAFLKYLRFTFMEY